MIRFPNIKTLQISDQERQVLYDNIYDIFIQYKSDTKWKMCEEIQTV